MNLFERAKQLGLGLVHITTWLGAGGEPADRGTAQERADICNGDNPTGRRCENNVEMDNVTPAVADAVRKTIEVKNKLELRVRGEKMLRHCTACGCVLRLLVHEPQERVRKQLTAEEIDKLPKWCWKLRQ